MEWMIYYHSDGKEELVMLKKKAYIFRSEVFV